MKKEINNLLNELGVPFSCIGRDYIERAVEIIKEKGRVGFHKDLYPTIAKQFCTTPSAVERGIRHAIERAAFKTLFDELQKTAQVLKGKLQKIKEDSPEVADKLTAALKAFGQSLQG